MVEVDVGDVMLDGAADCCVILFLLLPVFVDVDISTRFL